MHGGRREIMAAVTRPVATRPARAAASAAARVTCRAATYSAAAASLPQAPYPLRARCWYQLHLVRTEAAASRVPASLTLLSLFGWSLGGVFVAAWDESPLGPYAEVALMCGLAISRDGMFGAWPQPLLVTRREAVVAGREIFGHDPILADIDFINDGPADELTFTCDADARARVQVPEALLPSPSPDTADMPDASRPGALSVPLPSLSGTVPRLRIYDLLVPLAFGTVRLAPKARVRVRGSAVGDAIALDANELLAGPALFAFALGPCVVVADSPRDV